MRLTPIAILLSATASCALPSNENATTGATREALGAEVQVLYFGQEPVAVVRAHPAGEHAVDVEILAMMGEPIRDWIEAGWHQDYQRKSGSIVSASPGRVSARSFEDLHPVDVLISADGEAHPIHVIASGKLGKPQPTNVVPPAIPVETGLPNRILVGCELLPAACAHASTVRLGWHAGETTTELVFTSNDAQDLAFDPAGLGAISYSAVAEGELTQQVLSLAVPAPRVIFAGPVVQNESGARRTIVLGGSAL